MMKYFLIVGNAGSLQDQTQGGLLPIRAAAPSVPRLLLSYDLCVNSD